MAQSIAEAVKSKRDTRKSIKTKNRRIYSLIPQKYDVCIKLKLPEDYPNEKFSIDSFHGLSMTNPSNFSKGASGKNSRYCAVIKGNGCYWDNNIFDLMKYYNEYDWMHILHDYPKDVASYEHVCSFLKEISLQVKCKIMCFFFFICI